MLERVTADPAVCPSKNLRVQYFKYFCDRV
jgi:hypothetical protein